MWSSSKYDDVDLKVLRDAEGVVILQVWDAGRLISEMTLGCTAAKNLISQLKRVTE